MTISGFRCQSRHKKQQMKYLLEILLPPIDKNDILHYYNAHDERAH